MARREFFHLQGRPNDQIELQSGYALWRQVIEWCAKMGPRREILTIAIEAAKMGVEVVAWTVPGKQKLDRVHRAELIHAEYRRESPLVIL